jgi:hypothetical protein
MNFRPVLKDERVVLREEILVLKGKKVSLREGKLGGKFGIKGRNSSLRLPPLVPP